MKRWLILLVSLFSFFAVACGDGGVAEGSVPGAPAAASDADREVEVTASDEPRFDPSSLQVGAGEVVTFVIYNAGENDHEFVLGDETYQNSHQAEMAEGHHMMGLDNAVTLEPGETKELTWEFSEEGEILFGCHEPGHYEGGMVGTIEVD
jgi:uncharacterized cupredoxin-like copper-binding protein